MRQIYTYNIFGTRIDNLSKKAILDKMNSFLCQDEQFNRISTLNPEILLQTKNNLKLQKAINSAELNIADGIGIKFAFLRYGNILKVRYSGIDLVWDILRIANEKNLSIYLVANKGGLSTWQETRDAILKVYPNSRINGMNIVCHPELVSKSKSNSPQWDFEILKQVQDDMNNESILLTNLGAPHQELFLQNIKDIKNSSLQIGVGVGGAFDYISKKVSRAPKFMRVIGFEWLFRFTQQPHRCKRIWNAVVIFPLLIVINKK